MKTQRIREMQMLYPSGIGVRSRRSHAEMQEVKLSMWVRRWVRTCVSILVRVRARST